MAKKLLIVEDEDFLLDMYKIKFQAEGYEVYTAVDGEDGLKQINEILPDLTLLDVIMPKMDGYAVLKAARENDKTKKLKIYLLSNLGQSSEIEKGKQEGADGYFIKSSLTPTQLAAEVKKII